MTLRKCHWATTTDKADLIRRFNEFMKQEVRRLHLDYPLVITLEKQEWEILWHRVQNFFPCNHDEADTRITYHCNLEYKPTVVIASDTGILILLVHAFVSSICIFLIMTAFYIPRKISLRLYLRYLITMVMQLESRCQQCSSSPAVIQWVTTTVSPKMLYLNGPWSKKSQLLSFCQIWESITISQRRQKKTWKNLSRCLSMVWMFRCMF